MKRFRRKMTLLVICALLLCTCAHADGLADWTARYNAAASSAELALITVTQELGSGTYGILLDEGGLFVGTDDESTVAGVIVTGISSQSKLALVCGAALYACDSTLTTDAAMEKMIAFVETDDASSERFSMSNDWVFMLESNGAETIVCLIREDLFAAFAAEGIDFSSIAEDEQPSDSEATPSEAPASGIETPSATPTLPQATPNPILHKI